MISNTKVHSDPGFSGVGLTNAAVNTTSQLIQEDEQHPFKGTNVAFSFATGYLGFGGGLGWNIALNTASGTANTQVNNWLYNGSDSVIGGAVTSGLTGGTGYLAGSWVSSVGNTGGFQYMGPVVWGNIKAGSGSLPRS